MDEMYKIKLRTLEAQLPCVAVDVCTDKTQNTTRLQLINKFWSFGEAFHKIFVNDKGTRRAVREQCFIFEV